MDKSWLHRWKYGMFLLKNEVRLLTQEKLPEILISEEKKLTKTFASEKIMPLSKKVIWKTCLFH